MNKQREKGEFGGSGQKAISDIYHRLHEQTGDTVFLGYEGTGHEGEGTVKALVRDGNEHAVANAGEEIEIVTDRTPFYGESGGQMGDTGEMSAHGGRTVVEVLDTQRPVPGLVVHKAKVKQGSLNTGDMVLLSVNGERRNSIRANHSATHLLHKALKLVLGDHVKQAGLVVAPDYLRFDYSHFAAPTTEQLEQVEDLVNRWIRENAGAETRVMPIDEAKKAGAVALFGEKYGDVVRVVSEHPQLVEPRRHTRAAQRRHRPLQDHPRRGRLPPASAGLSRSPVRVCSRARAGTRGAQGGRKTGPVHPEGVGEARRGQPEAG